MSLKGQIREFAFLLIKLGVARYFKKNPRIDCIMNFSGLRGWLWKHPINVAAAQGFALLMRQGSAGVAKYGMARKWVRHLLCQQKASLPILNLHILNPNLRTLFNTSLISGLLALLPYGISNWPTNEFINHVANELRYYASHHPQWSLKLNRAGFWDCFEQASGSSEPGGAARAQPNG